MPLLVVALAVVLLLVLMTKFRLNGIIALFLVAVLVGLARGMPIDKIYGSITDGVGGQLDETILTLGFGAMLGKVLADSGGADRIATSLIRVFGISRAQWAVLIRIERTEGLKQSELAELLDLQPISLTRLLDRLADNGLIERRADPNDRRANAVNLTPRGREVLEEVTEALAQLRLEVFKDIPPEDAETVVRVLRAIEAAAGSADR